MKLFPDFARLWEANRAKNEKSVCVEIPGRAAQRNFFELDFDFDFCKKWQARTFFGKARKNFAKVKVKIEK
jgi:hypothetical protein